MPFNQIGWKSRQVRYKAGRNMENLLMTDEEALALLDSLLPQKLKDIQELVFRYSWQGWTYSKIAEYAGYDIGHIRDVGSKLWQQLSEVFGEQVSKNNLQAALHRQKIQQHNAQNSSLVKEQPRSSQRHHKPEDNSSQYWGENIDVPIFYGRDYELDLLQKWIIDDRCRLIALLGMGGIGKTTLAVKLVERLQDQFDFFIWQSLRNAPPIEEVITHLIHVLSEQQTIATTFDAQLSQLMDYLRTSRCLLVFDNAEAILESRDTSSLSNVQGGKYRDGYVEYGELFRRVGVERHNSCLLFTSREKPKKLDAYEGKNLPVRTLSLTGLDLQAVQAIATNNGCFCRSPSEWQHLMERYSGNPLALKIVSTTVQELFDGDISQFLVQETIAFGDIVALLDEQFNRLSELEKQVMYWLAINREWVAIAQLHSDMLTLTQSQLLEALQSLGRSSLIERSAGLFTLQPVVMEYVTDRFITQVSEEIITQNFRLFLDHALLKAEAKDYIRDSQIRVIIAPLAIRLMQHWRKREEMQHQLNSLLQILKAEYGMCAGYGGGNLINLLRYFEVDLRGYDFSGLRIWQAYLQNISLHGVNFSNADLARSVFTETLATPSAVAFSPNGQIVATGDLNGEVRLWRSIDGKNLLTLPGHSSWIWSLVFSPDGETLASGSEDQTVKLWDLNTGQCRYTLIGHTGSVWSVAYSTNGEYFASGSEDGTVKLWNLNTGQCWKTLTGHSNWVRSIAFCPTAPLLASAGDDGSIKLWNLATGNCDRTLGVRGQGLGDGETPSTLTPTTQPPTPNSLQGQIDRIWSIAFSPNTGINDPFDTPLLVSGSSDSTVRVWNVKTGECLQVMEGHANWVRSVAFSPDGQTVASGSEDHTIKLWNVHTGQCQHTLKGHSNWVRSVAFSSDGGTLASGSGDHSVKLWDVATGCCQRTLKGYTNRVWSVAMSKDGKIIASGNDDYTVRLWHWNPEAGGQRGRGAEGQETSCTGGFSKQPLSPIENFSAKPAPTTQKISPDDRVLRGHTNAVCAIAFSPIAPVLASGSSDHTIKLWDLLTGQCLQTLRGHTSRVWSVVFNPDGKMLASGSDDRTIKLWDSSTGQCQQTLQGHSNWVCAIAFSPNLASQLLASASYDQTVKLWDIQTGECLKTLLGHTNWVWSTAFSPDGQTLASGSGDRTIKLWDVQTGDCLQTLHGHTSRIWSIAFSPRSVSQLLASGSSDRTIKLWNLATGECCQTLQGHTSLIWSVAFSADGHYLVSGSQDETVRLWEVETGNCLAVLKAEKPYDRMNIAGVTGLTDAQIATLCALGALT
ncbi:NB-ARC domain-containing protein [Aerosakkonemataceae cyanobacterium BLCC-F50]|uniref:NB-ARC domain-containing protein n=1 Tax=Floridaenema flaviceps BLCC-F50 TaxID=3153642 RepID=A0ABV4XS42_9CYAN